MGRSMIRLVERESGSWEGWRMVVDRAWVVEDR